MGLQQQRRGLLVPGLLQVHQRDHINGCMSTSALTLQSVSINIISIKACVPLFSYSDLFELLSNQHRVKRKSILTLFLSRQTLPAEPGTLWLYRRELIRWRTHSTSLISQLSVKKGSSRFFIFFCHYAIYDYITKYKVSNSIMLHKHTQYINM